jgi:hypothetical protein
MFVLVLVVLWSSLALGVRKSKQEVQFQNVSWVYGTSLVDGSEEVTFFSALPKAQEILFDAWIASVDPSAVRWKSDPTLSNAARLPEQLFNKRGSELVTKVTSQAGSQPGAIGYEPFMSAELGQVPCALVADFRHRSIRVCGPVDGVYDTVRLPSGKNGGRCIGITMDRVQDRIVLRSGDEWRALRPLEEYAGSRESVDWSELSIINPSQMWSNRTIIQYFAGGDLCMYGRMSASIDKFVFHLYYVEGVLIFEMNKVDGDNVDSIFVQEWNFLFDRKRSGPNPREILRKLQVVELGTGHFAVARQLDVGPTEQGG